MHRTYVQDEGKWHEYFYGPLEATKSVVTAHTEVTPTVFHNYVFEDWFIELFKENAGKKEFQIGSKKFVPDYTVHITESICGREKSNESSN